MLSSYGIADSMSVWNLLREFRIRKVHMAVVLNEYGGTVGVCWDNILLFISNISRFIFTVRFCNCF